METRINTGTIEIILGEVSNINNKITLIYSETKENTDFISRIKTTVS